MPQNGWVINVELYLQCNEAIKKPEKKIITLHIKINPSFIRNAL